MYLANSSVSLYSSSNSSKLPPAKNKCNTVPRGYGFTVVTIAECSDVNK